MRTCDLNNLLRGKTFKIFLYFVWKNLQINPSARNTRVKYTRCSDVSRSTLRQHPPRPGWAASQPRCVISTVKSTFYKAVPSPVLFPSLDDVWERPLVSTILVYLHRWKHLLFKTSPRLVWIGMRMVFPTGNMSLIGLTLALLIVVLCTSQGKIIALRPGRAPLANGLTAESC